ncbi:hypothetical protein B0H16DRAFT_1725488 [Mycena metata]|uniref:Uncharacterized protein n=1 Tax=Mycena metata TaxID=1033252 RepID=A0AAD7N727_9AGAR|nr:hypothetical protein B0H16DRAFT_1725488 [Mycena metata]
MLPAELEREIFELCALYWPNSIPRLLLVAHRVNEWIGPMLYRTLLVGDYPSFAKQIFGATFPVYPDERVAALDKNSPPSSLAAVRHLFLSSFDGSRDGRLLAACINVENLSLSDAAWTPLISCLPLKHLYTSNFIPGLTLAHLTHLEIRHISPCLEKLASIPRLTHLSVFDTHCAIFSQLLRMCTGLQVLVGQYPFEKDTAELAQDVRFVVTDCCNHIGDWYMGAQWGNDYWHRAEIFIAKRRAREIDPLQFRMDDESPASLLMQPHPAVFSPRAIRTTTLGVCLV